MIGKRRVGTKKQKDTEREVEKTKKEQQGAARVRKGCCTLSTRKANAFEDTKKITAPKDSLGSEIPLSRNLVAGEKHRESLRNRRVNEKQHKQ